MAPITSVLHVDNLRSAKDPAYARSVSDKPCFVSYDPRFERDILGQSPELHLVKSSGGDQFAHEAGVYIRSTNSVYFTSNYQSGDVRSYSVDCESHKVQEVSYPDVTQPNGACHYKDRILYCSQGDRRTPSALVLSDPKTNTSEVLLNNFQGREFSSVNDVVIHHVTGDIWFTDPTYGYEQGFRPSPELPKQVYRFNPKTGQCWVVADGFDMCNGLAFSPDYSRLYVTDTGAVKAKGLPGAGRGFEFNSAGPGTIYVYDVVAGGMRLENRRMFAFCAAGVPDGIKCDENGYVYSGCGDGVHVWDEEGTLVGRIVVGGVTANFCFVKEGMWMFAEKDLWLCKLKAKGTLVKVECE